MQFEDHQVKEDHRDEATQRFGEEVTKESKAKKINDQATQAYDDQGETQMFDGIQRETKNSRVNEATQAYDDQGETKPNDQATQAYDDQGETQMFDGIHPQVQVR